jgi:hypothetical protein
MQNHVMHQIKWFRILTASVFLWSLPLPVWGGVEEPIELSGVPKDIIKDVKTQFPDATILGSDTEAEKDGSIVYEIQGTLKDGRKFEYDAYPDGEVQEIEIEFQEDMVPGAVTKAIQRKLPGFKPTYIEASHSRSMKVVKYEFEGEFEGKKIDIEVSADGSRIEIADR